MVTAVVRVAGNILDTAGSVHYTGHILLLQTLIMHKRKGILVFLKSVNKKNS
jgi:hypothetical protein